MVARDASGWFENVRPPPPMPRRNTFLCTRKGGKHEARGEGPRRNLSDGRHRSRSCQRQFPSHASAPARSLFAVDPCAVCRGGGQTGGFCTTCSCREGMQLVVAAGMVRVDANHHPRERRGHGLDLSTHTVRIQKLAMPDIKAAVAHNRVRPALSLAPLGNVEGTDQFKSR